MATFDLPFSSDVLDVDLFSTDEGKSLAAAALVNGRVGLVDYSPLVAGERPEEEDEDAEEKRDYEGRLFSRSWTTKPGSKSCRGARFTDDGLIIRTINKDCTLAAIDLRTGKVANQWTKAHDSAPSRILPLPEHKNHFVTGDDDGVIKLWDDRQPPEAGASQIFTQHTDWITDMTWIPQMTLPSRVKRDEVAKRKKVVNASTQGTRDRLVAVAGDGILSVMDLRFGSSRPQGKVQGKAKPGTEDEETLWRSGVEVSADQEDELLAVRSIRSGKKLVVGTGLGPISIWSPSKGITDHVDRLTGHPSSVDSIHVLDSSFGGGDTLLTASSDGMVRIVDLYPHKLIGVAADHGGFPVERVTARGDWMASVGHESFVRLTNLRELLEADSDAEDEDEDEDGSERPSHGIVSVGGSEDPRADTSAQMSDSETDSDESDPESLDSAEAARLAHESSSDESSEQDSSDDEDDEEHKSHDVQASDQGPKDNAWGSDSDSDAPPKKKPKTKEKPTAFTKQVLDKKEKAQSKQDDRRAFFDDL